MLMKNAGNAGLVKDRCMPLSNSFPVYSIYKMLPDTDLTVLREGNIQTFAFIDDHYNYHGTR
jgi:hypothetical protein